MNNTMLLDTKKMSVDEKLAALAEAILDLAEQAGTTYQDSFGEHTARGISFNNTYLYHKLGDIIREGQCDTDDSN